jgi:hypothetical protein
VATADGAAHRFGEIARDYHLSVLAQAEPAVGVKRSPRATNESPAEKAGLKPKRHSN